MTHYLNWLLSYEFLKLSMSRKHIETPYQYKLQEVKTSKNHISATSWRRKAFLVSKFASLDDLKIFP